MLYIKIIMVILTINIKIISQIAHNYINIQKYKLYHNWAATVLIEGVHCVIHHWKAGIFSILMMYVEL